MCFSGNSWTPSSGPVPNPYLPTQSSGGSSSGSASLVARGIVDMAIGSDQAGSIRIPACWCGIVGLKPTYGLVPYTGIMSIEPAFDHVGPMARTVYDCALLLDVKTFYTYFGYFILCVVDTLRSRLFMILHNLPL